MPDNSLGHPSAATCPRDAPGPPQAERGNASTFLIPPQLPRAAPSFLCWLQSQGITINPKPLCAQRDPRDHAHTAPDTSEEEGLGQRGALLPPEPIPRASWEAWRFPEMLHNQRAEMSHPRGPARAEPQVLGSSIELKARWHGILVHDSPGCAAHSQRDSCFTAPRGPPAVQQPPPCRKGAGMSGRYHPEERLPPSKEPLARRAGFGAPPLRPCIASPTSPGWEEPRAGPRRHLHCTVQWSKGVSF